MTDICCIGHITIDKIITPATRARLNGGTAFYFSNAISQMPGVSYKLVTCLNVRDMEVVERLRETGVDVNVIPSRHTVIFENKYDHNLNNRTQRVLAQADPFSSDVLKDIEAHYIHLGSLLADDFSFEVILSLVGRGMLSVDAQGFLRHVDGTEVVACDWPWKRKAIQCIDILKVNEHEIESLTGTCDLAQAGKTLDSWGAKEVVMTLGSRGSVIWANGRAHEIPAYKPKQLIDATGCGDTYAAGYLYMRSQGAGISEAGHFAAAMATLNLEQTGPFCGTISDVENVMKGGRKT